MSNRPHVRPNGHVSRETFADEQMVIQPGPTPVSWLAGIADFPDALKGTTIRMVTIDCYHQLGMQRAFLEPEAAMALAEHIAGAAKLALNRGVQVVEGAAAHQIARQAKNQGDGHG